MNKKTKKKILWLKKGQKRDDPAYCDDDPKW